MAILKHILFTSLIAVATATACFVVILGNGHTAPSARENAFDRVMRTGVLRCGYIPYAPEMMVDPATGKLSGFVYDMVEALGKASGLKVTWVEEVSTSNMFEGLHTGRYDALCSALFEKPAQARKAVFTTPIDYSESYMYARAKNDSVSNSDNAATLDRVDIKVAVVDGEMSSAIAHDLFPHARIFALPPTASSPSEALTAVATGKADIAFSQKAVAEIFMSHNLEQVKQIGTAPVTIMSQTMASFDPADVELKNFFDSVIHTLYTNGTIPRIFQKYDPKQLTYKPLRSPY